MRQLYNHIIEQNRMYVLLALSLMVLKLEMIGAPLLLVLLIIDFIESKSKAKFILNIAVVSFVLVALSLLFLIGAPALDHFLFTHHLYPY